MRRSLIPFNYGDTPVRVVSKADGPWFVLADICAVLEIASHRVAAGRLDEDEKETVCLRDGIRRRGNPNVLAINESGLWSLVMASRKPEAKRFKKWLTSEVIPSIRQTGGYQAPQALPAPTPSLGMPQELLAMMREQTELMKAMREQLLPQLALPAPQASLTGVTTIDETGGHVDGAWWSAVSRRD